MNKIPLELDTPDNNIEWINREVFNKNNKLNPRSSDKLWWVKKNAIHIWDDLHKKTSFLSVSSSYAERVFCYTRRLTEVPYCKICLTNQVKYQKQYKSYAIYCSNKCQSSDSETHIKKKQTSIAKYGHTKDFSSVAHRTQSMATIEERYGVSNYAKSAEFVEKSRNTQFEKYNNLYVRTPEYHIKRQSTSIKKYGESSWMKLPEYRKLAGDINKKVTPSLIQEITTKYINGEACQNIAIDTGISKSHMYKVLKAAGLDTNLPQNKINYHNNFTSVGELELRDFLVKSFPQLKFEYNVRNFIWPYELDIVCHETKTAYEYNGTYWHSDFFKHRLSHLEKLELVEEKGYRLVTIFENYYKDRRHIIEDKLLSFSKTDSVVYARNTEVSLCSYSDIAGFINSTHVQGTRTSRLNYSVKDNNGRMIAAATFNNFRDGLELVRFSSIVRIPGILSKIISKIDCDIIYSFANRCYTSRLNNVYLSNGFCEIELTPPNYFYVKGGITMTRNSAMKHKLSSILPNFDNTKSEYENMIMNGYHRTWDCGNILYQLKKH